jgi:hypothetical protein
MPTVRVASAQAARTAVPAVRRVRNAQTLEPVACVLTTGGATSRVGIQRAARAPWQPDRVLREPRVRLGCPTSGAPGGGPEKAGHPIASSTRTRRGRRSPWTYDEATRAAAERSLREARRCESDPEQLLRRLEAGEAVKVPLRSDLALFVHAVEALRRARDDPSVPKPDSPSLRQLLLFCRRSTALADLRGTERVANALVALSACRAAWLRPLEAWEAASHNAERQLRSLLRHLVARYDVPPFFDAAWLEGLTPEGALHQQWYLLVASGTNIRKAPGLPIPLTKRQAHLFLQAPDDLGILAAFRWAKVLDLGGDDRLARAVLGTRIGTEFGHEDFWDSVVRWFVAHPGLDLARCGPIVDYLWHQKFERQPNLQMKGRTPEALLRDVREWHRGLALARFNPATPASWAPSGIVGYRREEDGRVYEVVERLTAEALREEGAAMGHCVASYTPRCATGATSIWSLRVLHEGERTVRLATIEVRNRDRTVVQVRRRYNNLPKDRDFALMAGWEAAGGPARSEYLVPR